MNFGLKGRIAQLTAWNGIGLLAVVPVAFADVVSIAIALRFVGLNMNPSRMMSTWIIRMFSGTPFSCRGSWSLMTVSVRVWVG